MMIKYNFIKTITAGVVLAMALYPQAWAEIKSATSCGGKCTYYYDTVSKDLRIEKKANVADGEQVMIPSNFYYFTGWGSSPDDRTVNNVTIGEGITGMGTWAFVTYGGYTNGSSNSTLTLPSTYKHHTYSTIDYSELFNVGFGTIDASAVKDTTIYMRVDHNQNVILDPNSNVKIEYSYAYNPGASRNINTICKGKLSECEKMIIGSYLGQITSSYYVGDDGNGNWEVWSDDGVALYTDSTLQKPLGKYDFDGNQTGVYKYDGAGNLTAAIENGVSTYRRTSYTPAEAAAAIKKGNNNTVTLTFK